MRNTHWLFQDDNQLANCLKHPSVKITGDIVLSAVHAAFNYQKKRYARQLDQQKQDEDIAHQRKSCMLLRRTAASFTRIFSELRLTKV
jgi:hypothetical protein